MVATGPATGAAVRAGTIMDVIAAGKDVIITDAGKGATHRATANAI
jgi:hypothetical protein